MDIIDKARNTKVSVKGNRIRISSQRKQPLTLFGVFVYSPSGAALPMNTKNATSSSVYQGHTAAKALRIVNENSSRNVNQAISGGNLLSKLPGWNNWDINGAYATHTNNDGKATTGGDWWEYKFDSVVDIAAIEVFGRDDCCPERMQNMLIQIFNDGVHADAVWDDNTGRDPILNTTKLFIIEKNGVIRHQD
jgi:hypothetical protein